jgi:hypothetical protein
MMKGWAYYQTSTLALVPYMPGTPVYRDGVLVELYRRTRDEGKIDTIFCGDDLNLDAFVAYFEKRKTMQVLCKVEDNKTLKPAGYCWADLPRGVDGAKAVMCGFCFFEEYIRIAKDLGRLGVAYWFEDLVIDVIHGVLLESNDTGAHYARLLGFKDVAVVPKYHYFRGELVDARVMMLEKKDFMPAFNDWFETQKEEQIPVEIPA